MGKFAIIGGHIFGTKDEEGSDHGIFRRRKSELLRLHLTLKMYAFRTEVLI